jgi:hypothetical protein
MRMAYQPGTRLNPLAAAICLRICRDSTTEFPHRPQVTERDLRGLFPTLRPQPHEPLRRLRAATRARVIHGDGWPKAVAAALSQTA